MKRRILLILFFGILQLTHLHAQGTNNKQPLDSADFVNMFRQLGMEVFKFPFRVNENKKYHMVFSFDVSQDGKVEKQMNQYEDIKKSITKNSPYTISDIFPLLEAGDKLIRSYVKHTAPDEVAITYGLDYSLSTTAR